MAADYTRNIVFNVNDKAIKRATDRITRSLTNIEKTLQRIERKGFNNLAKSAETASKQITNTNKNVAIAQKRIQLLGNAGKEIGGVYQKSFGKVFSTFDKLLPIVSETKETIRVLSRNAKRDLDLITFATKASGQGISKLVELFRQGQVSAITFVTGVSAIISKTKEFGSVAITNLTTLGRLIEQNTKKAGTLVNVLGFKTGIISQPLNLFQNTQAAFEKNTLLARQNAMRGNVGRNIGRSQAARRDSDFLSFSQDADFATRTSGQSRRITSAMMQSFPRPLSADGSPFIGPLFDKNTFVSRVGRPAGFIGPDRPGIQDPTAKAIRRNETKRIKFLERIAKSTARSAALQQQQVSFQNFAGASTGNFGVAGGQIGPRDLTRAEKFGFGQFGKRSGLFAFPGGRSARIKGGIGSALIGGGFPALFGAGGLSSAFGGIAGGLGGALAPGGGFAASIFATAIAGQIEKSIEFNKAVQKLNVSIKATGGTSLFTAEKVKEFAKSLGITKDEALEALKAFQQFDASARIVLSKFFGSEAIFDTFAGIKDNASIINALPGLSKELSLEQAKIALETLKSNGASAAELKLREQIFNKNTDILRQEREKSNPQGLSKDISFLDLINPFRGFELGKEGNIFQRFLDSSTKSVKELRELRLDKFFTSDEFTQELEDAKERLRIQKEFNEELERQAIIKAPVDELNKLLDPLRQIDSLSKSIGDSFAESFKGIVSGSMTAQEALRNLFQRTADHFLDMAAQILAAQVRSGIMGLFNFNKNKLISSNSLSRSTSDFNPFEAAPGMFFEFANGGRPPVGRPSIVGEKGPELFVPDRAGTIIPNNQLGGMAGAMNVIVNVDASGSSVEGDEQGGRELGRLISVAIQSELIQQKRPGGLLA